jgi:hypothetical protein
MFLGCPSCAKSTFSLASVSALSHQLIDTFSAFAISSPAATALLADPGNSVFLDWYQLSAAESAVLITRLLSSRLEELEASVLLPVRKTIEEHASRTNAAAASRTIVACQRAIKASATLMGTLRAQLIEAEEDGS